ncbi:hypothetical protein LAD77_00075 [Klebsiella pneumoniae]|nr:hypothetical protein [Klebsiella pneumoniae]
MLIFFFFFFFFFFFVFFFFFFFFVVGDPLLYQLFDGGGFFILAPPGSQANRCGWYSGNILCPSATVTIHDDEFIRRWATCFVARCILTRRPGAAWLVVSLIGACMTFCTNVQNKKTGQQAGPFLNE